MFIFLEPRFSSCKTCPHGPVRELKGGCEWVKSMDGTLKPIAAICLNNHTPSLNYNSIKSLSKGIIISDVNLE